MGLVNFAHGDVVMVGAYLASTFYLSARLPFAVAMVVAIVVTGAIGLIIERVLRPLENKDFDLMLIGTIGFGIVLEAAAILIWGATGRAVPSPVQAAPLDFVGLRIRTYDLVVLAVAAVAMVAAGAVPAAHQARRRDAGGRDGPRGGHRGRHPRRAQQRDRVRHRRRRSPRWPAGWSGRCSTCRPTMGGTLGIKGFAAAILGGFGSIPGAIVGGLAIGVLDSFAAGHFQGYSELVTFVVFTVHHHDPADRHLRREDGEPGMSLAPSAGAPVAADAARAGVLAVLAVIAWLLPYGLGIYAIHVVDIASCSRCWPSAWAWPWASPARSTWPRSRSSASAPTRRRS